MTIDDLLAPLTDEALIDLGDRFADRRLRDDDETAAHELRDGLRALLAPQVTQMARRSHDAQMGYELLRTATQPHAEGHPDHSWRKCPKCLALQEIEHEDGQRFIAALLDSLSLATETA